MNGELDGVTITGETTGSTYELSQLEVGKVITVAVTYSRFRRDTR